MTGLPDLLTVEEAARILRIGRTKAYAMASEWRRTGGESGLPVVDIGGLRVPTCQLEVMTGAPITSLGPVASTTAASAPIDAAPAASGSTATTATEPEPALSQSLSTNPAPPPSTSAARSVRRPSRRRIRVANQPTLPFPG
jgi:hypothetical protein